MIASTLDIETPAVTHIRPQEVDLVFGPPSCSRSERIELKRKLLHAGMGVLDGDWDIPAPRTFANLEVYKALEARITQNARWQDTPFYDRVMKDFARGRRKWGCSNEEEFIARCARLDRLHHSLKAHGYRSQADLGTGRIDDEVRVAVRRDGRLLFLDGRHRLAIARILGISRIPVRIPLRHAQWAAFKQDVLDYAAGHHGRIYQTIDHPDLCHIPAGHGIERIEMIRTALRPYAGREMSLLDIGAHWGYMCQQLERLGFSCRGVELNRQSVEVAERLSVATSSSFTVWRGSIFEYPDIDNFDVVLALNIFHHFIKTEELHAELQRLLGRLRAQVMIFEAHRHSPPAQMTGAFRNYAPDEFAEFVRSHAGFSHIKRLGAAPEGRQLFQLSR